ncbi:hypothetical protein K9M74_00830 [Candidatus Woesearchaeota archaeon]|nr:hypothetical protein [Candidatus Woesearchaeota archaeon]
MGKVKNLLVAGGITLGALGLTYLGEKTQPVTKLTEAIKFHNVAASPSTPENYKLWHVEVLKDQNNDAVVSFTDDSTSYFLHKELGPVSKEEALQYEAIKNKPAAEGTPQDFLNGDIAYKINEQGRVEMYFGNKATRQYWQVNSNWTAGDFGERIDDIFERLARGPKWTAATEQKIKEKAIEGWEKADSLYQQKKDQITSGDSLTKQNFWDKIKETTIESYENVKGVFEKK